MKAKRQHLSITLITLMAITLTFVLIQPSTAGEKWDMPCAYSAQNFISQRYIKFAEIVTKNSDGKLEIVVHPSGSLYKGSEIMRAVRSQQVPIGAWYFGAHSNEDPIFGFDLIPFLTSGFEDAWKLYQVSKPELEKVLANQNLKLLFTAPWPPQGLFSKKEVNRIADMKGVRFRAYDTTTTRLAQLMGAIPTKTEASEISQAFSTGVAESMIASGAIGVFQKIWDYVDYYYKVNAWIPKSGVTVNIKAWNKLDNEIKQVILNAAAQIEKEVWEAAPQITESYNKTMAENKMKVLEPTTELRNEFKEIGEQVANEWAKSAGEKSEELLNAYKMP
jgi:TRAP-type C4-dicarboxylate transport system substrate-binding protein